MCRWFDFRALDAGLNSFSAQLDRTQREAEAPAGHLTYQNKTTSWFGSEFYEPEGRAFDLLGCGAAGNCYLDWHSDVSRYRSSVRNGTVVVRKSETLPPLPSGRSERPHGGRFALVGHKDSECIQASVCRAADPTPPLVNAGAAVQRRGAA